MRRMKGRRNTILMLLQRHFQKLCTQLSITHDCLRTFKKVGKIETNKSTGKKSKCNKKNSQCRVNKDWRYIEVLHFD